MGRNYDDHTGYPVWADTAGKQAAVRAYWRMRISVQELRTLADQLDEIFGIPPHSADTKFWHVSPCAGQLPKWVSEHVSEGSLHIWESWMDHGLEPDRLLAILKQYGWIDINI